MGIFISVWKIAECAVIAAVIALAYAATLSKLLGILQSLSYGGARLFRWARRKGNADFKRRVLLTMLCALSYGVMSLCFSFAGEWAAVIGLAPVILFLILYVIADKRVALRSPLSYTPRVKRLYVVLFVITLAIIYFSATLLNYADYVWGNLIFGLLRYLPLTLLPVLSLPIVALSNVVDKIYETPRNSMYIKSARAKLAAADITVIGITGSFGKTSTKQILSELLSVKYRVLSTPRSHNTPLGLSLALNSNDLKNYDIFIAEMGARHLGDIERLCKLCPPDYSIITGVCPQHLESFGTIDNIYKAKGEILAATRKKAVVAADVYNRYKDNPLVACADSVSDVECSAEGTRFTLTLGGEERKVFTKLLGAHAAENIALAAQVAFGLGVSAEDICAAIGKLDYVEHRLQLIKQGGVNILDDGYNSNVKGASAALDVLRAFGGRKVVVTPGLVELGVLEESENYALGKNLAGFDLVILVGDTLVDPVKRGYLHAGGDQNKIKISPTLFAAEEILKQFLEPGDAVLFLNDLPDIY